MADNPKDIYDLYKQSRAYNALGFFADPTSQRQMASGLTNALSRGAVGVVGAPVDMLTMGARAFGYGVPSDKVVGSSDWIGRKLENAGMLSKNRNALAELLTGFVSPDPMDAMKLSAMVIPAVAKASKADGVADAAKAAQLGIKDDILKILEDDDHWHSWGLRVIPKGYDAKVGDVLPNSTVWDDGIKTSEELPGTSTIFIRENNFDRTMKMLKSYQGDQVALVRGRSVMEGNDPDESIIENAEVVKTWGKDFFYGK